MTAPTHLPHAITHVDVHVTDMTQALDFYEAFLGLHLTESTPHQTILQPNPNQQIRLIQGALPDDRHRVRLGFHTPDPATLTQRLADHNFPVAPCAPDTFHIDDPDGNALAFTSRIPDHPIPPEALAGQINHTGIYVADPAVADTFYAEVLGFTESWRGSFNGKTTSWIHMQTPHSAHYVEYMLNAQPPPHFCILVDDAEAQARQLQQKPAPYNKPIEVKIGKNRRRILNLFDPDGTRVELMEPRTIDGQSAPTTKAR